MGKRRLQMPLDRLSRNPRGFPRMIHGRLIARALVTQAGLPLGHVAGFGGIEAEAEAEADPAVGREDAGDEDLVAGRAAEGMDVDVR